MNTYDQQIEKTYHPENFLKDLLEDSANLVDIFEDAVDDLSHFSADHDDILASEVDEAYLLVKRMRLKL